MSTPAISQSRYLIAQSKETRASVKHLIETSQHIIRDSLRLIQRANQTCDITMVGSAGPEKPDVNTDKECEAARAGPERRRAARACEEYQAIRTIRSQLERSSAR